VWVGPVAFTVGWLWSGARNPQVGHATRSVSALGARGAPCRGPVLAGQVAAVLGHLLVARRCRRPHRAVAAAIEVSAVAGLAATIIPLPGEVGPAWFDPAHTGASVVSAGALHLAPLLVIVSPATRSTARWGAGAALAVAVPSTGYFVHRLTRHGGTGRVYGWAERAMLTALLVWTAQLPAALAVSHRRAAPGG
jgi:hypothetical protein